MHKADRGGSDELTKLLLLSIAGCMVATALYSTAASELRPWLEWVAWVHLVPVARLAESLPGLAALPLIGDQLLVPAFVAERLAAQAESSVLGRQEWNLVKAASGRTAALLYILPLSFLAYRARILRPDLRFRTTFDLDNLIRVQTEHWLTARLARSQPTRTNSPVTVEHDDRPSPRKPFNAGLGLLLPSRQEAKAPDICGRSLRPEEWLLSQGLVDERVPEPTREELVGQYAGHSVDAICSHLTVNAIDEVFEEQLGPPWSGFETLKFYEKALAAAFACNYGFRTEDSEQILDTLATFAECHLRKKKQPGSGSFLPVCFMRRAETILASPPGREIKAVADRHAWQTTAFLAMLRCARKNRGVLAAASFSWLKSVDRTLWYALNNAGNAAVMAEAAGVHAHYRAERQYGCALYCPCTFQASRALHEGYLDQVPHHIKRRFVLAGLRKPVATVLDQHLADRQGESVQIPKDRGHA